MKGTEGETPKREKKYRSHWWARHLQCLIKLYTMNNNQQRANSNNQSLPSVDNKNQKDTSDEMNSQSTQQQQQVCAYKFIIWLWFFCCWKFSRCVTCIVCFFIIIIISAHIYYSHSRIVYEFIELKVIQTFEIAYEIDKHSKNK